jgi:hypothetical protein
MPAIGQAAAAVGQTAVSGSAHSVVREPERAAASSNPADLYAVGILCAPQNPHSQPRSHAARSPKWELKASGCQCGVTNVSDRA